MLYHIVLRCIISRRVASCRVVLHHVALCCIMSRRGARGRMVVGEVALSGNKEGCAEACGVGLNNVGSEESVDLRGRRRMIARISGLPSE